MIQVITKPDCITINSFAYKFGMSKRQVYNVISKEGLTTDWAFRSYDKHGNIIDNGYRVIVKDKVYEQFASRKKG